MKVREWGKKDYPNVVKTWTWRSAKFIYPKQDKYNGKDS